MPSGAGDCFAPVCFPAMLACRVWCFEGFATLSPSRLQHQDAGRFGHINDTKQRFNIARVCMLQLVGTYVLCARARTP